jgi:acetyltransferase-like isoleucine patch superfamily enzyme
MKARWTRLGIVTGALVSRARGWAHVREAGLSIKEDVARLPFEVVVNVIASSPLVPRLVRTALYRFAGLDVAWGAVVYPRVYIRHKGSLHIGRGSTINQRCYFENKVAISLGEFCGVGPDVLFITTSHEWDDPLVRAGRGTALPIRVENGTWIGARATVLGGVTVGEGCVIGAHAVVNRSTAPHGLYAGLPGRRMRDLPVAD